MQENIYVTLHAGEHFLKRPKVQITRWTLDGFHYTVNKGFYSTQTLYKKLTNVWRLGENINI